ncbi:MAG TPA: radical SAM protein [Spirochaetia bacterium]|nr:radical SAM protein [Spirochaetia bacterium]
MRSWDNRKTGCRLRTPVRRVRSPFWPPGLIARQAASVLLIAFLSRWKRWYEWIFKYGFSCIPGAAGSKGMGCIGFPDHPVWEITGDCNLHCLHCHVPEAQGSTHEMTTGEGRRLLQQLAGVSSFRMMAFTGGEPLLRKDLFDLLAYSQVLGFTNTLATNATLVDRGVARHLRERGVAIGYGV